jgi:hypothetical protein
VRAKAMLKEVNEYFFLKEEAKRELYNLCLLHKYNKSSQNHNSKHNISSYELFNKKFLEFLGKEGSLLFARDFADFQVGSSNLFDGYIDCSNHDHH